MFLYVLNPNLEARFIEQGYTFLKEELIGNLLVSVFRNDGTPFEWPLLSVIVSNEISFECADTH